MNTRLIQSIAVATIAYCFTAFALAAAIYFIVVMSGNAALRDPTGAPVQAIIPPSTIFVSALFVGVTTTLYSSGGLLGAWLLSLRCSNSTLRQIAGSALLAMIGSGIFVLGSSLEDDQIAIRALSIGALSVGAALLVIVYAPELDNLLIRIANLRSKRFKNIPLTRDQQPRLSRTPEWKLEVRRFAYTLASFGNYS